jgi:hypothetical protein
MIHLRASGAKKLASPIVQSVMVIVHITAGRVKDELFLPVLPAMVMLCPGFHEDTEGSGIKGNHISFNVVLSISAAGLVLWL